MNEIGIGAICIKRTKYINKIALILDYCTLCASTTAF